jgi:hypothetical protein
MQVRGKPLEQLEKLFSQKKCWRIDELHQLLHYSVISIRGFLSQVGYFSSFTHNSKWYTLSYLPVFDKNGLWFYEAIGFSKHGNLKKSILYFINKSPAGLSAKQLAELLLTPCHAVLNHMFKSGDIDRVRGKTDFIYLCAHPEKNRRQLVLLQPKIFEESEPQKLSAQTAVYVLIEFIKHPQVSFAELSKAVAKRQVIATPQQIACFFEEHDLKKTQT